MKHINRITLTMILMAFLLQAKAQRELENSMSQYFQSRMLWNPGFTGADGSKIYILQNRSWIGFDGAPVMTGVSGEFLFGANSAAGLQVVSDLAGVLNRTTGVLNYAYRIKFRNEKQLRIGISLLIANERLNTNYFAEQGGVADPMLVSSINQQAQFDGNLGFVYTDRKLSIGACFYRLSENFSAKNGGNADLAFAQIGGGYDIDFNEKVQLKPLMMLRMYRNTGSLLDIGAQFEYNKLFNAMLLYQTNGNVRTGLGLCLKDIADVNFFYNTNVKITNASSQQYELGIGFYLAKKKL